MHSGMKARRSTRITLERAWTPDPLKIAHYPVRVPTTIARDSNRPKAWHCPGTKSDRRRKPTSRAIVQRGTLTSGCGTPISPPARGLGVGRRGAPVANKQVRPCAAQDSGVPAPKRQAMPVARSWMPSRSTPSCLRLFVVVIVARTVAVGPRGPGTPMAEMVRM
jgi:hypothetical protein